MDAIVAIDQYQNIALFNRAAERMFGRAAQEVMGQPVTLLMPPHLARAHQGHVRGFMASGTGSRTMAPMLEITGLRADGSQFPVESTISQTLIDGRRQLTAVLRDVTERRRAEREMHEMNRQLRGLSASLQNIREQERTRIARELHDELGQQLTGLKLELSWLGGRIKDGRPPAADRVDEMRHMLDAAVASVRRLSSELRPLILDDLGFGEAVAWQSGEFAKRTGLQVSLDLQAVERVNAERARSGELPTVLFRIVQESLTNIARHARAENVEIHLIDDGRNLVLTVSDDGQGMADGREPGGFGLVSMRERAASLGGNFAIISGVGLGTTIQVELSLALPIFAGATA
jgi:PAS domain S-box-containing protein